MVLNITRSKRRRTDPPTEKALVGWAILQDVSGVVLFGFLLAAISAGERPWYLSLLGLAAFIGLAWVAAWILPRALRAVHEDKDLFLVVTIGAGLALAGLGGFVLQIPMALAAFIAGLAISESHESAEARRRILPFRDLFAILFFVPSAPARPVALPRGAAVAGGGPGLVIVAKAAVAYVLARVARLDANPLQLAVGLAQIGEFSVRAGLGGPGAGRDRPDPVHGHPGRGGDQHRRLDRRGPPRHLVREARAGLTGRHGAALSSERSHPDGDRKAVPGGTDPLPCGDPGRQWSAAGSHLSVIHLGIVHGAVRSPPRSG